MRSNGPTLLALPAFRGLTRKIILLAIASFLFFLILGLVSPGLAARVAGLLHFTPASPSSTSGSSSPGPSFLAASSACSLRCCFSGSSAPHLKTNAAPAGSRSSSFSPSIAGAVLATLLSLLLGSPHSVSSPSASASASGLRPSRSCSSTPASTRTSP